jgi:hypothetical protein
MAEQKTIIDGLRFAEIIHRLDDRSAKKIALALAGSNPTLFMELYEATREAVNPTLKMTTTSGVGVTTNVIPVSDAQPYFGPR